ncbi:MAG: tetratricopeptide repeat protein [Phycisphaerales bacterium]
MAKDAENVLVGLHTRAMEAFRQHKFEEALRSAQELVAAAKAHYGQQHPLVEQALATHGDMLEACGEPEAAEPLHREALAIRRFFVGAKDPALIPGLNRLAAINLALDRHAIAEPLIREAIEICRELPEAQRPLMANPLMNLARVHAAADRLDEAEAAAREAFDTARTGGNEPVVKSMQSDAKALLGSVLASQHDLEGALAELRSSLNLKLELYGEGNAEIVNTRSALAALLSDLGDHEEADALTLAASEATRSGVGEISDEMLQALRLLSQRRLAAGHRDDCDRLLDAADAIRAATEVSPLSPAFAASERAEVFSETGEVEPQAELLDRAIAGIEPMGRALHPSLLRLLSQSMMAHHQLGNSARALRDADRLLRLLEGEPQSPEQSQLVLGMKGQTLCDLGRADEGMAILSELCAESQTQSPGPNFADHFRDALARANLATGNLDRADAEVRKAIRRAETLPGFDPSERGRLLHTKAVICAARGKPAEAAESACAALELLGDTLLRNYRAENSIQVSEDVCLRWCAEAALALACTGVGPASASLACATALHRCHASRAPSDLSLALRESAEHAPAVRTLIWIERQLVKALRESEPGRQEMATRRERELRARLATAERALCDSLPLFDASRRAWECDPAALGRALGGGTFVHFVRIQPPGFEAGSSRKGRYAPARYAAIVLTGQSGRCVDLEAASVIDPLVENAIEDDTARAKLAALVIEPLGLSLSGPVWIAAEGQLADAPFEALPAGPGLLIDAAQVSHVPSIGALFRPRRPVVSAAADEAMALVSPVLAPVPEERPEPLAIVGLPRHTWRSKLLGRFGMYKPKLPPAAQVDLSLRKLYCAEGSASLRLDRNKLGPSATSSAPSGWAGATKSGADASVQRLMKASSPRRVWIDAPWGLLPDQPYSFGDVKDQAWTHRIPPRKEPASMWHESPFLRAGVYLNTGSDAELNRRAPGVVSAKMMMSVDLGHTEWALLTQPPRRPRGGPTADAMAALAEAVLSTGARCLVTPRRWATPSSASRWMEAFFRESVTLSAPAAARKAALALRASGAPVKDWACAAAYCGGL